MLFLFIVKMAVEQADKNSQKRQRPQKIGGFHRLRNYV